MSELVFLKLGGSLITDKTQAETVRSTVLARLAVEIASALAARPDLKLVIGHGSGSFGHLHAKQHGTRDGVRRAADWRGFAAVSDAALRLNALVRAALLHAGTSVISLSPSASAVCHDGELQALAVAPIRAALEAGLTPLLHGDVAFDAVRGGTIVSTEELLVHLARSLPPDRLLLAGETDGVLDSEGRVVARITPQRLPDLLPALGGSRGADVTGGMASKVRDMLAFAAQHPAVRVRIFSGLRPGNVERLLLGDEAADGTSIAAK